MPQSSMHLSSAQLARQERRRMMLGETVGALRRERGMTQQQLAEAVGVSTRGVIRIEQGQTSLTVDVLWRVADALDLRVSALMRMAEEREAGGG
ncbi:helix-turn-helix domain-containing protein [Corynebacterium xerosis]|uniref:helix-turn-helix domain-containing protein n=1 Tax=Corynebacterium xerosis TaxID=1725 RepID=UPI001F08BE5B|nr:helix-turn-helix transcriptional regulator [Corynebacterium xerosis]